MCEGCERDPVIREQYMKRMKADAERNDKWIKFMDEQRKQATNKTEIGWFFWLQLEGYSQKVYDYWPSLPNESTLYFGEDERTANGEDYFRLLIEFHRMYGKWGAKMEDAGWGKAWIQDK